MKGVNGQKHLVKEFLISGHYTFMSWISNQQGTSKMAVYIYFVGMPLYAYFKGLINWMFIVSFLNLIGLISVTQLLKIEKYK